MNYRLVFRITGRTLLIEAAAILIPLFVTLYYREDPRPFLYTLPIMLLAGLALGFIKGDRHFFPREGFLAVGLIWILLGIFGAFPFYFYELLVTDSGQFPTFIDCLFESVSGFTTTGATILTDIEALPKGLLFWRSFSQYLGGMGVLGMTIALLPSIGTRTLNVMRAESTGPVVSKLVPKASQSAKILYLFYGVFTVIPLLLYRLAGLGWYDSVVTALSTASTGGFSVKNLSIAGYANPAVEVITTVFMIICAVNFMLYFLIITKKWKAALKSDELRFFLIVIAIASTLLALDIYPQFSGAGEAVRHAVFSVASVISTTGYATVDFNLLPQFACIILVALMFCGACAGSTGGGIKCARLLLIFKCIRRELRQIIHPRTVNVVRLDGKVVEESSLRSVLIFFAAYIVISLCAILLVALDNLPFVTTTTAVISSMGNVGPGLDAVGPMGSFAVFSPLSKLVLSACMIMGRLEIFPILILFSRNAWKRT